MDRSLFILLQNHAIVTSVIENVQEYKNTKDGVEHHCVLILRVVCRNGRLNDSKMCTLLCRGCSQTDTKYELDLEWSVSNGLSYSLSWYEMVVTFVFVFVFVYSNLSQMTTGELDESECGYHRGKRAESWVWVWVWVWVFGGIQRKHIHVINGCVY
jgi:hypothetical protein